MKPERALRGEGLSLPVFTLWQRELVRFWREKARVLGIVGSPLVFWLVIGSGFGDLGFFFPGALTLTVMFSAVFSNMSLIEDRREGFLLSVLVSPAPRIAMVLGKVLGAATLAWIQGMLFLAFLPLTQLRPSLPELLAATGTLFLISFAFAVLGFLFAWRMDSTQGFHAVINLLLFPLWMVSGSLFPAEKAHGWIQWLTRLNPMTYFVAGLRRWLDSGARVELPSAALSLTVTALCAGLLLAACVAAAGQKRPSWT